MSCSARSTATAVACRVDRTESASVGSAIRFALFGWYAFGIASLFAVVFVGANAITALHAYRVSLWLPGEGAIPFVPSATLLYSSLYGMFALMPFVLRTSDELRSAARVFALEIVIAGACFVLIPMDAPGTPYYHGRFAAAFEIADRINLDHNMFPSLHATFGFTAAVLLSTRCGRADRILLGVWAFGIALAAVLTKQHVVIDIAGALLLTWIVIRFGNRRRVNGRQSSFAVRWRCAESAERLDLPARGDSREARGPVSASHRPFGRALGPVIRAAESPPADPRASHGVSAARRKREPGKAGRSRIPPRVRR